MNQFDVIFLSYGEPNADSNWKMLKKQVPTAKRLVDVVGIINAYLQCAEIAKTKYFYLVDADNCIFPTFSFDFKPTSDYYKTFIFKAKNPVNNLEYGFGGIKLYHRESLLKCKTSIHKLINYNLMSNFDFPVANPIKFLPDVASVTLFNSSEYVAWRSAFRECCKLKTLGHYLKLDKQQILLDMQRLNIWTNVGHENPYGDWVIKGALAGKKFAEENFEKLEVLKLINDYSWLKSKFEKTYFDVLN